MIIIGNIEGINENSGLKTRMDKNIYYFINFLKSNSTHNIEICDSWEKEKIINLNKTDKIIYILPGCTIDFINLLEGIKIYEMMDVSCRCTKYKCEGNAPCRAQNLVNYLKSNKYDYLLYHYKTYIFYSQYNFMNKQFYFPHFIDHNINKDYGLEKKYDILFYGNDWIKVYPFRNRLKKLLRKSNFNTLIIEIKNPVCGEELAKLINQSWIVISTKSYHNLLLQKYIEIAMCKSVICGDFPDLEEKIFEGNMIYIDIFMKDDEIINILKNNLSDKNKLLEMAKKSYETSLNYTYEKGNELFNNIITNIIEENKTNDV